MKKKHSATAAKKKAENVDSRTKISHRLLETTDTFLADIECISEMYSTIIPVLEVEDKRREEQISSIVKSLAQDVKNQRAQQEKQGQRIRIVLSINQVTALSQSTKKIQRANRIFKSNSILMLFSRFEDFLAEIMRCVIMAHPERLRSSEKTITYEDALKLKSPEDIILTFVEKEVDPVMRESVVKQLTYLQKLFNSEVFSTAPSLGRLVEVSERRNVHAHCGGKVTEQYLQNCKKYNVKPGASTLGEFLEITPEYMSEAISVFYEVGSNVGQYCYRKLFPDKLDAADTYANSWGYDALVNERWSHAEQFFRTLVSLKDNQLSSDTYRKIYLVNLCIALQALGKQKEVDSIMEGVDWSAAGDQYQLAKLVLLRDFKGAGKLMSTFKGDKPMPDVSYRDFPLFKAFRETVYFQQAFKAVFNKDFIESSVKLAADELKSVRKSSKGEDVEKAQSIN